MAIISFGASCFSSNAYVLVILNILAPNSTLPILSYISSLYLKPFRFAISFAVSPLYNPLYPALVNLSKFLTPFSLAILYKILFPSLVCLFLYNLFSSSVNLPYSSSVNSTFLV